jgi:transposase
MGWYRVALTTDERVVVNAERDAHPDAHVRRKMLVLWLLHCGLTRVMAAEVAGVGRATVQRYVAAHREGGLDGLRAWGVVGPVSGLTAHTDAIRDALTKAPVRTVAEACDRIATLTGVRRKPTQVRAFLAGLGFKWRRVRAVPVPPKSPSRTTSPARRRSWMAS